MARLMFALWSLPTSRAFSAAYGAIRPAAAWRSTQTGATRVGDQGIAAVEHQLDAVLVEVDAVLDRVDAGAEGVLDPLRRLGVGHHLLAGAGRLLHARPDLLDREMGVVRVVAGREDAARGADLHPIGARPDDLADAQPHRLDAVDDLGGDVVLFDPAYEGTAGKVVVGVAAGLAQDGYRHQQPGAGEVAALDRRPHAGGRHARVTDGGEARLERLPGADHAGQDAERGGRQQDLAEVEAVAVGGEVDVAVDQPRQQGQALGVDLQRRPPERIPHRAARPLARAPPRRPRRRRA